MSKKQRLKDIMILIEENEIDTQEELTEKLNGMGYNVSQATVSRDINELNLVKVLGSNKKFRYARGCADIKEIPKKYIELFKHVTVSFTLASNLIVLRTLSGNAGTAGMAIDAMKIDQILGTIAGDDTLLIITKTNSDAEKVIKTLRSI